MSSRQPARRPLRPKKIDLNPNVRRGLGGKASVDNTGKFSAALSRFAMVISSLLDQEWLGHPRNRRRQN
jgi:hypothetical protein